MKTLQHTAVLWLTLVSVCTSHAEEMGRLFFTPAQRTQLNEQRDQSDLQANVQPGLTVNGIVQKNGGSRTAWINGVAQHTGRSDEHHPNSLTLNLPSHPDPVTLKVGQTLGEPAKPGALH